MIEYVAVLGVSEYGFVFHLMQNGSFCVPLDAKWLISETFFPANVSAQY